jgi:hypothetical protein
MRVSIKSLMILVFLCSLLFYSVMQLYRIHVCLKLIEKYDRAACEAFFVSQLEPVAGIHKMKHDKYSYSQGIDKSILPEWSSYRDLASKNATRYSRLRTSYQRSLRRFWERIPSDPFQGYAAEPFWRMEIETGSIVTD